MVKIWNCKKCGWWVLYTVESEDDANSKIRKHQLSHGDVE